MRKNELRHKWWSRLIVGIIIVIGAYCLTWLTFYCIANYIENDKTDTRHIEWQDDV